MFYVNVVGEPDGETGYADPAIALAEAQAQCTSRARQTALVWHEGDLAQKKWIVNILPGFGIMYPSGTKTLEQAIASAGVVYE